MTVLLRLLVGRALKPIEAMFSLPIAGAAEHSCLLAPRRTGLLQRAGHGRQLHVTRASSEEAQRLLAQRARQKRESLLSTSSSPPGILPPHGQAPPPLPQQNAPATHTGASK